MKKMSAWMCVALVLAISMVLGGCGETTEPLTSATLPESQASQTSEGQASQTSETQAVQTTGTQVAKAPIKIGFSNSATGIYAGLGAFPYQAWEAWAKKMDRQGGILGHPVETFIYDSESDPAKVVLNVKNCVDTHKVQIMVAETATGNAIAGGLAAAASGVPFLAASGSSTFEKEMEKAGPDIFKWCFRGTTNSEEERVAWILQTFQQLGVRKVAVLYSEDAFGKANASVMKDYVTKYADFGIEIIAEQSFASDAVTFGPLLSNLRAHSDLEGICVWSATMAGALSVVAIREAGLKVPIAGDYVLALPPFTAVEKVREGLSADPGVYMPGNLSIWRELPDGLSMKAGCEVVYNFCKAEMNVEADHELYVAGVSTVLLIEDVYTRLLTDQPDILDKDVETIRAAVRDYIEATDGLNVVGTIEFSPTHHGSFVWGTYNRMAQYGSDGKPHYLSEFAKVPVERY